jgi:hypothetical protein
MHRKREKTVENDQKTTETPLTTMEKMQRKQTKDTLKMQILQKKMELEELKTRLNNT